MPNVFSHPYQLDEFISNFRVVGWYFSFLYKFKKKLRFANSGDPDQTPHFAASGLFLHCLSMSHKTTLGLCGLKCVTIKKWGIYSTSTQILGSVYDPGQIFIVCRR